MKITHNKEHCFLAVWALQQYGGLRVADADENDDDARGVKKKHSSRGGHLPKELVRKIVEYLIYPSTTGREEVGRPHKYPGCLVSYRPLARSPRQSVFC